MCPCLKCDDCTYVVRATLVNCARNGYTFVLSLNTVDKECRLLVQEVSTGGSLQKAGTKVPHIPPKPVVTQGQVGLLVCSFPCLEDPVFPECSDHLVTVLPSVTLPPPTSAPPWGGAGGGLHGSLWVVCFGLVCFLINLFALLSWLKYLRNFTFFYKKKSIRNGEIIQFEVIMFMHTLTLSNN